MLYRVHYSGAMADVSALMSPTFGDRADAIHIKEFRPEGSSHRPQTSARLLYDDGGISGIFTVQDQYVRSVHTGYQDPVYKDSCVEFFVRPKQDRGYFNFEFNCGGCLRCGYIVDPTRVPGGFRDYALLTENEGRQVRISHSLPSVVDPEIAMPVTWQLGFFIPLSILEPYVGPLGSLSGQTWQANFFKCGDETSHPHWASWTPLPEKNFHLPECFGRIRFEEPRKETASGGTRGNQI